MDDNWCFYSFFFNSSKINHDLDNYKVFFQFYYVGRNFIKMDSLGKELAQYDLDLTEATIPTIYNNTESILYPAPHQEMMELYLDFSEIDRMLAVWPTGSGKTVGSLRVAWRFIENSMKGRG